MTPCAQPLPPPGRRVMDPAFSRFHVRLHGLLLAAGAIASAATLLGFLGEWGWVADLFSHFRVQYFIGLSIISILLPFLSHRRAALCFAAFAVVNLATILPLYFGKPAPPPVSAIRHRAMLINVNTYHGDPAQVARAVQDHNPDLVVLEEVNESWIMRLHDTIRRYPHFRAEPRDDNFGIALLSKFPFLKCDVVYLGDAWVPTLVAEVEATNGTFTLIATHPVPPSGAEHTAMRNDHLQQLVPRIRQAESPVLLLGDLNVSPWNKNFQRLVRESGLKDSAQGRGVQATWPTFSPLLLIPLDHCLHSADIRIAERKVGPRVGSDHLPLIVDFVLPVALCP